MYVYVTGIDDGDDLDPDLLAGIYERIKGQEFRPGVDQVTQVMKVEQTIVGKKPVSAPIDIRQSMCTCVCFMRVCVFCVNVCVFCVWYRQYIVCACFVSSCIKLTSFCEKRRAALDNCSTGMRPGAISLLPVCLFFFFPSHTHVRVGCLHQSQGGCL